jgi:hypothetical protein
MFYKKRYVSLKFMFSPFPDQEIPATIGSSETETAFFVSLLEMTGRPVQRTRTLDSH